MNFEIYKKNHPHITGGCSGLYLIFLKPILPLIYRLTYRIRYMRVDYNGIGLPPLILDSL